MIIADDVGRDVLQPGSQAVAAVHDRWPDVVRDGVVDRAALAAIVFTDDEALADLEGITHPAIAERISDMLDALGEADVIVEVPVMSLFEGRRFTRLAVVADDHVRLARAVARGGEPSDVKNRMASQPSSAEWRAWADHMIDNTAAWGDTEQAVRGVIDELRGVRR